MLRFLAVNLNPLFFVAEKRHCMTGEIGCNPCNLVDEVFMNFFFATIFFFVKKKNALRAFHTGPKIKVKPLQVSFLVS